MQHQFDLHRNNAQPPVNKHIAILLLIFCGANIFRVGYRGDSISVMGCGLGIVTAGLYKLCDACYELRVETRRRLAPH